MRWKELYEDDRVMPKETPDQQVLSAKPAADISVAQPEDIVSKNEQKLIARAKAPVKGKRFRTLADQDAYVRRILST